MFQKKVDEVFSDITNFVDIADNILIAWFDADGWNLDARLEEVL